MTDNFDSNKKLTPYKEIVKKRVLDYYTNKEAISQKRKEKYKQMPLEEKKSFLSITNNGLINNRLKDNEK